MQQGREQVDLAKRRTLQDRLPLRLQQSSAWMFQVGDLSSGGSEQTVDCHGRVRVCLVHEGESWDMIRGLQINRGLSGDYGASTGAQLHERSLGGLLVTQCSLLVRLVTSMMRVNNHHPQCQEIVGDA